VTLLVSRNSVSETSSRFPRSPATGGEDIRMDAKTSGVWCRAGRRERRRPIRDQVALVCAGSWTNNRQLPPRRSGLQDPVAGKWRTGALPARPPEPGKASPACHCGSERATRPATATIGPSGLRYVPQGRVLRERDDQAESRFLQDHGPGMIHELQQGGGLGRLPLRGRSKIQKEITHPGSRGSFYQQPVHLLLAKVADDVFIGYLRTRLKYALKKPSHRPQPHIKYGFSSSLRMDFKSMKVDDSPRRNWRVHP